MFNSRSLRPCVSNSPSSLPRVPLRVMKRRFSDAISVPVRSVRLSHGAASNDRFTLPYSRSMALSRPLLSVTQYGLFDVPVPSIEPAVPFAAMLCSRRKVLDNVRGRLDSSCIGMFGVFCP